LEILPYVLAYFPSVILLKYCSFRWHTLAEKTPYKLALAGGHTSPKNPRKYATFVGRTNVPKNHGNMPGFLSVKKNHGNMALF
jgi:hypothetical protein